MNKLLFTTKLTDYHLLLTSKQNWNKKDAQVQQFEFRVSLAAEYQTWYHNPDVKEFKDEYLKKKNMIQLLHSCLFTSRWQRILTTGPHKSPQGLISVVHRKPSPYACQTTTRVYKTSCRTAQTLKQRTHRFENSFVRRRGVATLTDLDLCNAVFVCFC